MVNTYCMLSFPFRFLDAVSYDEEDGELSGKEVRLTQAVIVCLDNSF